MPYSEMEAILFGDEPLLWLGASSESFALASSKCLTEQILRKLPSCKRSLEPISSGLTMKNELGPVRMERNSTLLFSAYNYGAESLAREVQGAASNLAENT